MTTVVGLRVGVRCHTRAGHTCSRRGRPWDNWEATRTAVTFVRKDSMGSTVAFVAAIMNASHAAFKARSKSRLASTSDSTQRGPRDTSCIIALSPENANSDAWPALQSITFHSPGNPNYAADMAICVIQLQKHTCLMYQLFKFGSARSTRISQITLGGNLLPLYGTGNSINLGFQVPMGAVQQRQPLQCPTPLQLQLTLRSLHPYFTKAESLQSNPIHF